MSRLFTRAWGGLLGMVLLVLSACSPEPAVTPPQLAHTPGAFVVVDERIYDAGVFRVAYPAGWRIVKSSIASSTIEEVTLVAPDDSIVISLSTDGCWIPEGTPEAGTAEIQEAVALATADVCIRGRSASEHETELQTVVQQLRKSLLALNGA